MYEILKTPTRLYIKRCSHCNLQYFGKTVERDIRKYDGSGVQWKNHLLEYNSVSIHVWNSDWYYDTSIKEFALMFSSNNKIVSSDLWANLKEENGTDGGWDHYHGTESQIENARILMKKNRKPFMGPHSDESKTKISLSSMGRLHTKETKEKLSKNNFARKDSIRQREHAKSAGTKSWDNREFRNHSEDTKATISKKMKEIWKSEEGIKILKERSDHNMLNPKRWIYSESEKRSRMILCSEPLPDHWVEGRKIKFQ